MIEITENQANQEVKPEVKPAITQKEAIEKFVNLFHQIESYNDDLKEVKEECKGAGLNAALLASVAKAIVQNKLDDMKLKSELIIELIEENNL